MNYYHKSISTPITSSASFYYDNCLQAEDIFAGKNPSPLYSRMGNPTTTKLENYINDMENGVGAIATSSGMGAISMAVLSLCSSGDEIIAIGGLFGGSYAFFSQTLKRFNIKATFLSADEIDKIQEHITTSTKIIFCESVGNPNLRLLPLKKIGDIAKKNNVAFIVDNTSTPKIVKPLQCNADIVAYSTTKVISGNSSALGGVCVFKKIQENDKFHSSRYEFLKPIIKKMKEKALIACAKKRCLRDFGMSANAYASYQTLLGLETLDLRLKKINENCEIIAKELSNKNINISHPSLPQHKDYDLYKSQYKNGCGSVMSIDFQTKQKAFDFLDKCKHIIITANIGDTRTLGIHMKSTICTDFSDEENDFLGVTDGLIRLSIGIEEPCIIIDDILNALS